MLAISSPLRLRSSHGHGEEKSTDEGEILLDDIDFDDIFVGFDDGGCDILIPDLEIDPDDIFADFSFNSSASGSGSGSGEAGDGNIVAVLQVPDSDEKELEDRRAADQYLSQNYEVVSGRSKEDDEEDEYGSVLVMSAAAEAEAEAEAEAAESAERSAASSSGENCRSGRKLSTPATATKGSHGKNKKSKKAKVDWTPELHRRFVQAVEQLGVDQAVPSRILQLMGIDCLTRHNIASHLQKYRSHRKHLLAREAEAASWSQRRQMYAGGGGGVMSMKRAAVDMSKKPASWQAASPIVGGIPPPPPHEMRPLIRPLHVWGHPSAADHRPQLVPVWPRAHLAPPPPQPWLPSGPPVVVGPPPPMLDHPSCWHPAQYQMALTQGLMPFFPPQLVPAMRFQAPPVPSIHPHPLFRPAPSAAAATTVNPTPNSSCNHSAAFDAHPSNEKIDAAIGDVLAKPWSALPLGLKPPSVESVMIELQRQGVAKVPPSSTSGG